MAGTLIERAKHAPIWTEPRGIFADLSRWPDAIDYYVKCPKCGHVHGNYASMREAHSRRLCNGCSAKKIEKTKELIAKVDLPGFELKNPAKAIGERSTAKTEAINNSTFKFLVENDNFKAKKEILSMPDNWAWRAKIELEEREGISLEFRDLIPITTNPNAVDHFKVSNYRRSYTIFKNEKIAELTAIASVKETLRLEPELFSTHFLQKHINTNKLIEWIGDPSEKFESDFRDASIETQISVLSKKHYLRLNTFYTKNGELKPITSKLQRLINAAINSYVENEKPTLNPWDYITHLYGAKNAIFEAINAVGLNIEEAAAELILTEGWSTFIAHYNGNIIELDNRVIAARNN